MKQSLQLLTKKSDWVCTSVLCGQFPKYYYKRFPSFDFLCSQQFKKLEKSNWKRLPCIHIFRYRSCERVAHGRCCREICKSFGKSIKPIAHSQFKKNGKVSFEDNKFWLQHRAGNQSHFGSRWRRSFGKKHNRVFLVAPNQFPSSICDQWKCKRKDIFSLFKTQWRR